MDLMKKAVEEQKTLKNPQHSHYLLLTSNHFTNLFISPAIKEPTHIENKKRASVPNATSDKALDSSGKYAAAQNTITIQNATKNAIDMRKKSLVSILFHRLHI
jgi:hypothetical protein